MKRLSLRKQKIDDDRGSLSPRKPRPLSARIRNMSPQQILSSQHRLGGQHSPLFDEGLEEFLNSAHKIIEENRKEEEEENEIEQESTALPKEDLEEGDEPETPNNNCAAADIFEQHWVEKTIR